MAQISKPDKDTVRKENYEPIFLMTTNPEILDRILEHQIQQHIKRITHQDQVGFISGIQDDSTYVNQ